MNLTKPPGRTYSVQRANDKPEIRLTAPTAGVPVTIFARRHILIAPWHGTMGHASNRLVHFNQASINKRIKDCFVPPAWVG